MDEFSISMIWNNNKKILEVKLRSSQRNPDALEDEIITFINGEFSKEKKRDLTEKETQIISNFLLDNFFISNDFAFKYWECEQREKRRPKIYHSPGSQFLLTHNHLIKKLKKESKKGIDDIESNEADKIYMTLMNLMNCEEENQALEEIMNQL